MKIKTQNLIGEPLDWAVRVAQGFTFNGKFWSDGEGHYYKHDDSPSTSWFQGGPIIEREGIDVQQVFCSMEGSFAEPCGWQAVKHTAGGPINPPRQVADKPLIAAMRCYVASKLGDEVDVPEGLT